MQHEVMLHKFLMNVYRRKNYKNLNLNLNFHGLQMDWTIHALRCQMTFGEGTRNIQPFWSLTNLRIMDVRTHVCMEIGSEIKKFKKFFDIGTNFVTSFCAHVPLCFLLDLSFYSMLLNELLK